MKKMLSLVAIVSLVAAPVFAEKCCGNKPRPGTRRTPETTEKCCGNKPRPGTRRTEATENGQVTEKCGCNANKPKGGDRGNCCGSCNTCKPCGGCCGK